MQMPLVAESATSENLLFYDIVRTPRSPVRVVNWQVPQRPSKSVDRPHGAGYNPGRHTCLASAPSVPRCTPLATPSQAQAPVTYIRLPWCATTFRAPRRGSDVARFPSVPTVYRRARSGVLGRVYCKVQSFKKGRSEGTRTEGHGTTRKAGTTAHSTTASWAKTRTRSSMGTMNTRRICIER